MKNTYYEQSYKCPGGHITKHYIWSNDLKKAKHKCSCGKKLTHEHLHTDHTPDAPAIRTPTKNR